MHQYGCNAEPNPTLCDRFDEESTDGRKNYNSFTYPNYCILFANMGRYCDILPQ